VHHPGFEACDLGLAPPGFPLGGLKETATTPCQRNEDEGADEIQTNSARHPRTFDEFI
jgi:hypothetical protein